MRLPVDLHERHKDLLREVERRFPTLRNPSLTDYVIGLLEEAEPTAERMAGGDSAKARRPEHAGIGPRL